MDIFGLEHMCVAARKLSLCRTSDQYETVQEIKIPKKTHFVGAECPKIYLSCH